MSRPTSALAALGLSSVLLLVLATPAGAHGFTTVVHVDATAPVADHVLVDVGLEYDLMLVSVADSEQDDPFYRQGQPAWADGDLAAMTTALSAHASSVLGYVRPRLGVSYGGAACAPTLLPGPTVDVDQEQGVPYAHLALDFACRPDAEADLLGTGHVVRSTLFASGEGYVKGAKTIVTYALDGQHGTAALDEHQAGFSTDQSLRQRFWEFFRLGAEHLMLGLDHLLFLAALIIGSRSLREIVLAATTFTLAHSTSLALAAFGVVHVPAAVVEPLIALSIAATASLYLLRVVQRRERALDLVARGTGHWSLDRAGWARLGVVFAFGLVHGMGFAGALGIDHAWSWALLWSLLVFNIGIESVQLSLVLLLFPALVALRRLSPGVALRGTAAVAAGLSLVGLVWFGQRVFGFHLLGEGA